MISWIFFASVFPISTFPSKLIVDFLIFIWIPNSLENWAASRDAAICPLKGFQFLHFCPFFHFSICEDSLLSYSKLLNLTKILVICAWKVFFLVSAWSLSLSIILQAFRTSFRQTSDNFLFRNFFHPVRLHPVLQEGQPELPPPVRLPCTNF